MLLNFEFPKTYFLKFEITTFKTNKYYASRTPSVSSTPSTKQSSSSLTLLSHNLLIIIQKSLWMIIYYIVIIIYSNFNITFESEYFKVTLLCQRNNKLFIESQCFRRQEHILFSELIQCSKQYGKQQCHLLMRLKTTVSY